MKRSSFPFRGPVLLAFGVIALAATAAGGARADEIRNPTATFAGLDKITGRIISFDVAVDETVQFGTLQITPRVCLTRPQTEAPLTEGFIEVDEIDAARQARRVFSGWMFAASPGLHGVEHPVYDVWLKDCKGGVEVVSAPSSGGDVNAPPPPNATPTPKPKKAQRTITPQNPVVPTVDSLPPDTAGGLATPPPAPAPDNSLGAPVEVGPPPGARAPDAAADPNQPDAPKKKGKKSKTKPVKPADAPPAAAPSAPQHAPPQQQPGLPTIFPKLF